MANAARVHAIERGQDLDGFTMIAFGGAAPLHAGRLAQKLGMRRVLIPAGAGVGSAIGFLRAPVSFEVVRSELSLLQTLDPQTVQARLQSMREQALAVVSPASHGAPLTEVRMAEVRYAGQGHELRVRLPEDHQGTINARVLLALAERFEAEYEQTYGLRVSGSQIEVVTWSVTVSTVPASPQPSQWPALRCTRSSDRTRAVWEPGVGQRLPFGVQWRFELQDHERIEGPALVCEHETTVVVPAGWHVRRDTRGHLLMEAQA